ncbi:MAG TPA: DUF370 domain-containing protein [Candidatus Ornithomonoglobus merdipullorum]|uniref:Putative regulatory protein IAA61_01130 n=1 Tax=Candidatus Ornithomonoglobus merdipullorum TaxID=2840895 RepID=A0A9D1M9L2_9FIRM|nr:DUF370 domain-containing protein [Candidatus Ornithomonoglobus merdipullorum]
MRLINIGFGNMVSAERAVAVISPDSAPVKRLMHEAEDKGLLVNATYGRRTRSVVVMDSKHVILSAITPEKLAVRLDGEYEPGENDDGEE